MALFFGTRMPGASEGRVSHIAQAVQSLGGLAITTLSSSQEGADCATVRDIGSPVNVAVATCIIWRRRVAGMADPEALNALSLAIRGRRHGCVWQHPCLVNLSRPCKGPFAERYA